MISKFLVIFTLSLIKGSNAIQIQSKPNILWIVIDDLGWNDLGFRNNEIKTPTIDELRNNGVTLESYYVQDVCSATRATFMTGRYAMHHGIVDWVPAGKSYGLPLNETTIADALKGNGYDTHAIGKWHLGYFKEAYTPTFRGFNSFYGFYGGGEKYFTHKNAGFYDFRADRHANCGQKNCSKIESGANNIYSTTLLSWEAKRLIEKHDESKPFFIYLAYQSVHSPAEVPDNYTAIYDGIITDSVRKVYAGMLSCVDEGIKNITDSLKQKGILDNTLIVFTSDNGGPTISAEEDAIGAQNLPLRGGKHSVWEGGTRVTAFVNGKMLQKTNYTFTHLMHGADWFPTFLESAGIQIDEDLALDGVSQWQAINNGNGFKEARSGFVYGNSTDTCKRIYDNDVENSNRLPCGFAIRDGDFKLILGYGGSPDAWCYKTQVGDQCWNPGHAYSNTTTGYMLYNISKDPTESHLEISQYYKYNLQKMKEQMSEVLKTYREEKEDDTCPEVTHQVDPIVGPVVSPWCDN